MIHGFRTALVPAMLLATSIAAAAAQPFEPSAFQSAQAAGRTILVDVTAPWCPTCRQQRPILEQVEREKPDLVVFEVDFDNAKDTLRRFRVSAQSTLVVFRGSNEVARSTGITDPAAIRALIARGAP
jgi:thiol-disulfide isomerase/thioredoxin